MSDSPSALEAENARLRAALAEREALMGMVEASLDGIWDWDIKTGSDYLSPRWKRMLGYTEAELPNTVETWQALLLPEDIPKGHAAVQAHWERGEPYELMLRYRRKDGSIAHMLARGQAVRGPDGEWSRMAGTHTDLTALVRAQAQVAALNADLEDRVKERTAELEAFAHSVSHDLRGPLRAIDGYTFMLEEACGGELPEDGRTALSRIRAGVGRMASIIDALLALTRVSRATLRREPTDLSAMAKAALAEQRDRYPGHAVTADIEPNLIVSCDRPLVRLALDNLIANAVKFTVGVAHPTMRLSLQAPGVLLIEDNGVGFDMRFRQRLFEPFARLHGASHPGSGMGLAIVERVIRRHQGRIWATSEVGTGARFFFSFDPKPPPEATP